MLIRLRVGFASALLLPLLLAFGTESDASRPKPVVILGFQANGYSFGAAVNADGRVVAFASAASNLVPGDTNRTLDVFVRDRKAGRTSRVSVANNGRQANGRSFDPAISDDGRFVAFRSDATNLVSGDTNAASDVFVRDVVMGTTRRLSVGRVGSQGNADSHSPSISGDGQLVVFTSSASNLVQGDTNQAADVFVHDVGTGDTSRVSVSSEEEQAVVGAAKGTISANGRIVVFASASSNLVPEDRNAIPDIFLRDLGTGCTSRVNVSSNGEEASSKSDAGEPTVSGDGRIVGFGSFARNLVRRDENESSDVFLHDERGETTFASIASDGHQANGPSVADAESISRDGRFVSFSSLATNLGSGNTGRTYQVFIRDRLIGKTDSVSLASNASRANGVSGGSAVSADGKVIAFTSSASNLVRGDTNEADDVFVHDRLTGATTRVSVGNADAQCRVPRLVGLSLRKARTRLTRAKCAMGRTRLSSSTQPRNRVLKQNPRAGSLIARLGRVRLVLSRGPSR